MSSSVKAALAANGAVAIAKSVGAVFTGSASLFAEAVHSFADCGNQLLLMFGMHNAKRDADKEHPLGYGKEVYFWSFVVALVLFTLGGVYSVYEGYHKLIDPKPLNHVGWAIGILIFAVWAESKSLRVCLNEIRKKYPGKSLRWFFKETRDPELLVIFGEDAAALTGLVIALVSLLLAWATGNPMWDAVGSILIGVLLMGVAVGLFMETKALLIGQSADPTTRLAMRKHLMALEDIEHVYDAMTLQMGSQIVLLLRIRTKEMESDDDLIDYLREVKASLYEAFPQFTTIFIEPDNEFEDH